MRSCSICKKLHIVRACLDDYKKLAHYHYRDSKLTAYAAIFALRFGDETVGVIVYAMPSAGLELRNVATDNLFTGFDKRTQLALINNNIRRISRVIIEPRFRSLGLASRLVRETMPQMNVPIVEAVAVMGLVNPFFEKAGMKAYKAKMPSRCVQLGEALSMVGIEKDLLIDPQKAQRRLSQLQGAEAEFIKLQIRKFLQSYGKRRQIQPGLERTIYTLSKLTLRPVYYIWFNPKLELLTN
ncbi:MAG TPA: hypothetical protein VMY06_03300 [Sedimentisphaerales bacterium]|nr:hypothetical protein [Sedimentisphaerales bacterium]